MKKFSRRDFFKVAGGAVIGAATYGLTDNISHSFAQSPVIASTKINDNNYIGSKAKVYFSSQINTDSLLKLYNLILIVLVHFLLYKLINIVPILIEILK